MILSTYPYRIRSTSKYQSHGPLWITTVLKIFGKNQPRHLNPGNSQWSIILSDNVHASQVFMKTRRVFWRVVRSRGIYTYVFLENVSMPRKTIKIRWKKWWKKTKVEKLMKNGFEMRTKHWVCHQFVHQPFGRGEHPSYPPIRAGFPVQGCRTGVSTSAL